MTGLYDKPGAWTLERELLRKEARRRIAAAVAGVAMLSLVPVAAAVPRSPGQIQPGQIQRPHVVAGNGLVKQ